MLKNFAYACLQIPQEIEIPKTHDAISFLSNNAVPDGIMSQIFALSVLIAIEFNCDVIAVIGKIEEIAAQRNLPPKAMAIAI